MLREIYGTVLREYRQNEAQVSMRFIARRAGISYSYLSNVELGQKDASSEMLEDICGALGLTVLDLLEMAADLVRETVEEEEAA